MINVYIVNELLDRSHITLATLNFFCPSFDYSMSSNKINKNSNGRVQVSSTDFNLENIGLDTYKVDQFLTVTKRTVISSFNPKRTRASPNVQIPPSLSCIGAIKSFDRTLSITSIPLCCSLSWCIFVMDTHSDLVTSTSQDLAVLTPKMFSAGARPIGTAETSNRDDTSN